MRLPMVDCRGLIEFCRAFEQHKHKSRFQFSRNNNNNKQCLDKNSNNQFCSDQSPMAAIDLVLLLLVIGSLGFLFIPYLTSVFAQAFPILCDIAVECINETPVEYFVGLVAALLGVLVVIVVWEISDLRSRKCGNPKCLGLRKAVEFDIQLESEDCLKYLPPDSSISGSTFQNYGVKPLELGQDRKELEMELKRMAPTNGRTVLIFRAPCGCPAGRLEVWGNKKIRKVKK